MLNRIVIALSFFMGGQLLNAAGLADRVLILVNDSTPPESGTLTVTTSNPTLSPDPTVNVDYVDDPT